MEPLHDFVLVEIEPPVSYAQAEGFTHVVVPEFYAHGPKDRAVLGRVLKRGSECRVVEQFQRVVIPKWRGAYLNPARSLMIIREPDIMAVIE